MIPNIKMSQRRNQKFWKFPFFECQNRISRKRREDRNLSDNFHIHRWKSIRQKFWEKSWQMFLFPRKCEMYLTPISMVKFCHLNRENACFALINGKVQLLPRESLGFQILDLTIIDTWLKSGHMNPQKPMMVNPFQSIWIPWKYENENKTDKISIETVWWCLNLTDWIFIEANMLIDLILEIRLTDTYDI